MEDSDKADYKKETLQQQFESVKKLTDLSEVMQWGDLTIAKEPIGNFLGSGKKDIPFLQALKETLWSEDTKEEVAEIKKTFSAIDSRNIRL